jgi:hypothetical protein
MKHIKEFKTFNSNEELNEGLKDWLIGGLMALSSVGFSQDMDKSINVKSTDRTEYQIHQSQLDNNVISGFLKYSNKITNQQNKLSYSKDGKYTLIKGSGFSATISKGSGYNKYSCFIGFGDESKPDAQMSITLKDDGVISLIFGEERRKEDVHIGGSIGTLKKGEQPMTQTELKKGDKGYTEAMNILNIFLQN